MKIFRNINEWKSFRKEISISKTLGIVPTMGALHEGHLSLASRCLKENDYTVVTIFLNPTQFNNEEDLDKYPQTWNEDIKMLEELKIDFLLAPDFEQIYPDNYNYVIGENSFSKMLCGASRPGHFDGVLTIVMKLFMLADADRAYFGEKDFQQLSLIRKMAEAFFIATEIISCPIIRENDGLAMSSRNRRLSNAGRTLAGYYAKTIRRNKSLAEIKTGLEEKNIKVDYLEEHFGRRFAAVYIDSIRLIDNFDLNDVVK
jgi:pantoate--beta-alanine ligase